MTDRKTPRVYLPGQPISREAERIALVEYLRPLLTVRGTVVTYEAIAAVIKLSYGDNRGVFMGVLNAVRRELLREDGIPTECEPGIGLRSKHDREMVEHGIKRQREAETKLGRAISGLSTIRPNEVPQDYLRTADSQRSAIAKLRQSVQMTRRTAQAELKGREPLPQLQAPEAKKGEPGGGTPGR